MTTIMTKSPLEAMYLVVDREGVGNEVAGTLLEGDEDEVETVNVDEIPTPIRWRGVIRKLILIPLLLVVAEDRSTTNMLGGDRAEVAEDEEVIEIILILRDVDEGGVAMTTMEITNKLRQWNNMDVEVRVTRVAVVDTIGTIVVGDDKDVVETFARIVVVGRDEEIEVVVTVEETVTRVAVEAAVDHAAMVEGVEAKMEGKIMTITGVGAMMVPVVVVMGQEDDLAEEEEEKSRRLFKLPGATRSARISAVVGGIKFNVFFLLRYLLVWSASSQETGWAPTTHFLDKSVCRTCITP